MYTRCPHCDTVFRVTPPQLQASSGQVRCGRCETVFDAFSSLSSMPPAREPPARQAATVDAQIEYALAPDSVPVPEPQGTPLPPASPDSSAPLDSSATPGPAAKALAVLPAAPSTRHAAGVTRLAQEPLTLPEELFQPGLITPRRRWSWLAINFALLCALMGQAVWYFATPLAMHAPALAPILDAYCKGLGCQFGLPRLPEQLFIETSDLQLLDVARPNQVLLTATIRNRAAFAQELPLLELTLTGVDNQTAARRVFAPAEYLDPSVDSARGIDAQQELSIRLYLDTANLRATGYRLYLFFV